jgi:phosphoserine phosphatase RsbU/P
MRILVVDDDPDVLEVIGDLVTSFGYLPVLASDGAHACDVIETQPIPIVITDWRMPGMDGLELTRRIRSRRGLPYTYVIVLTSLGGSDAYLEGMRAGADDFVTKPVSSDELTARLRVAERLLALQGGVRPLDGFLSICMYCKDVHVADAKWTTIERYIEERSKAEFSHGVCPHCYESRVRPDIERAVRDASHTTADGDHAP